MFEDEHSANAMIIFCSPSMAGTVTVRFRLWCAFVYHIFMYIVFFIVLREQRTHWIRSFTQGKVSCPLKRLITKKKRHWKEDNDRESGRQGHKKWWAMEAVRKPIKCTHSYTLHHSLLVWSCYYYDVTHVKLRRWVSRRNSIHFFLSFFSAAHQ
jgi:hypothetical protein